MIYKLKKTAHCGNVQMCWILGHVFYDAYSDINKAYKEQEAYNGYPNAGKSSLKGYGKENCMCQVEVMEVEQ